MGIMKLLVFYRKDSDHSSDVEEFIYNMRETRGVQNIEVRNVDSVDSQMTLGAHGIMQYPCLMVQREGGQTTKIWQGKMLPTLDEVSGYLSA